MSTEPTEDELRAFGILDKARAAAVESWPGSAGLTDVRRLMLNVQMQGALLAAFDAVRDDLRELLAEPAPAPTPNLDVCFECCGSGLDLEPITGRVLDVCRVCKGGGREECPKLGRLACVRKTLHDPRAVGGHEYAASSAPDQHDIDDSNARQDNERRRA